jgi:hypothetical protein
LSARAGWIAVACAAAAVGTGVGYGIGTTSAPVAPATASSPPRGDVSSALRALSTRIEQLEQALQRRPPATDRIEVPTTDTEPPSNERVEALLTKLSALADRLAVAQDAGIQEDLRHARIQDPQPNLAAVGILQEQLLGERELDRKRQDTRRQWSLLTMAEVITQLGKPTLVFPSSGNDVLWEYHLDDERMVTFRFRNGLVVDVDN